ncbi:glycosyl transferase [Weissella soli]|nr:glycosyl transferase [Weissella soli]
MRYSGDDVTILMSVYKGTTINQLIESVKSIGVNQTVRPKEIIVVIDGSVPKEVYDYLFDNNHLVPLKILEKEKNQGLALALRDGMKLVTTKLIARMDTDDISVNDRIATQLNAFNVDPNLALYGGNVIEFVEDPANPIQARKMPEMDADIRKFAKYRSPFNHPTVMFKKKIIDESGGYLPLGTLEDYFLWIRVLNHKHIVVGNSNHNLVFMRSGKDMYRRRGGGLTAIKNFWKLRLTMLRMKQISKIQFLIGFFVNVASVLLPSDIRAYIYTKFLRNPID